MKRYEMFSQSYGVISLYVLSAGLILFIAFSILAKL